MTRAVGLRGAQLMPSELSGGMARGGLACDRARSMLIMYDEPFAASTDNWVSSGIIRRLNVRSPPPSSSPTCRV